MKNPRSVFLCIFALVACGHAATADPAPREVLSPAQIEELVSPIALYPDPLVALILPASTRPSDIVLAARFLEGGGNPDQAAAEPWDDSVRALVRYREVIVYLDRNLAWTRSLGECFLDQPDAVMDAIQMVRVRAKAAGLLQDTPEQAVIVESDEIRIVPAQPTVIYVPRYDPEILYVSTFPSYYHPGPFLSFGIGYGIGVWLSYDCDWHFRSIRIVQRPAHWYHLPDWRGHHRDQPYGATNWTRWVPPPRHDRRFDRPSHQAGFVPRPNPDRYQPGQSRFPALSARPHEPNRPDDRPRSSQSGSWRTPDGGIHRNSNAGRPQQDSQSVAEAQVSAPAVVQRPPRPHQSPAYERPSPPARHEPPAGPRRDHSNPPPVRYAPGYSPPAPTMSAPPLDRPRPAVAAAPSAPRDDRRDRPDRRPRDEENRPRRDLP